MTEEQIKHMVSRFLRWKLPAAFKPDGGISYKAPYSEEIPDRPFIFRPVGTNLFTATQAEAMVRHMLEGLAVESPSSPREDTIAGPSSRISIADFTKWMERTRYVKQWDFMIMLQFALELAALERKSQ